MTADTGSVGIYQYCLFAGVCTEGGLFVRPNNALNASIICILPRAVRAQRVPGQPLKPVRKKSSIYDRKRCLQQSPAIAIALLYKLFAHLALNDYSCAYESHM